jgi:DNA-binding PadR family transcriptional regulator
MARTAQTDLAVLAALSVSPMTGYAVREAILTHLGSFWAESFGQIYPTLTRLAREGCVEAEAGDRAGSSVYSLTPAGREKLISLMSAPAMDVPPRNGLLLRLFFGNVLGAAACRLLVLEARERAEVRLAELSRIREAHTDEDESVHSPYWSITLSAGEHSARAAIAWATETLAVLDTLPGS